MTQQVLAERSGVRRWKIVEIEAARLGRLDFADVERVLSALDARLDVRAWYHGAAADRLVDDRHALIVGARVALHRVMGWDPRVEISFADYGERGSIDLLSWRADARALAVEEIKSELGSVEGTLRPFDVKCRLAAKIARERFGWIPRVIGRILVLPEDRTARRQVERHAEVLRAALPAGSVELRRWLRQPDTPVAGIWFMSDVRDANAKRNPSAILRVRQAAPRSSRASST